MLHKYLNINNGILRFLDQMVLRDFNGTLLIIYKEQFGIELCKPRKVSSYRTFALGWLLKKRNINPNQLVVAPIDLARSKYIHNT